MSPLFVTAESRERTAPGDPAANRELADRLFGLAGRVEGFLDDRTEDLSFEDYDALRETETKLLAFGNLLMASDTDALLRETIRTAADQLKNVRRRIS